MSGSRIGTIIRIACWGTAAALLVLPAIAMRFTSEVNWTASDFVFAAVLMGSVGLIYEGAIRMTRNWSYRGGVGLALAASFLLIWINGAVGIIGSEQDDANMLYVGVVAIAIVDSVVARFRSSGMAATMGVSAVCQLLVPIVAGVMGWAARDALLRPEVPIATAVFAGIWLLAAALFRKSAQDTRMQGA